MTLRTCGLSTISSHHHTILDLVLVLLHHLEERVDARFLLCFFIRGETMPQPVFLLACEIHVWLENREVILCCMTTEPLLPFFHLITMPANHTTIVYRKCGVGDYQSLVDTNHTTETLTLRTSSCRRVEREHLVIRFFERYAVCFETSREVIADIRRLKHQAKFSMTFVKRCFGGINETGYHILGVINGEAIYHEVDTGSIIQI